jgi:hypothetical protein
VGSEDVFLEHRSQLMVADPKAKLVAQRPGDPGDPRAQPQALE